MPPMQKNSVRMRAGPARRRSSRAPRRRRARCRPGSRRAWTQPSKSPRLVGEHAGEHVALGPVVRGRAHASCARRTAGRRAARASRMPSSESTTENRPTVKARSASAPGVRAATSSHRRARSRPSSSRWLGRSVTPASTSSVAQRRTATEPSAISAWRIVPTRWRPPKKAELASLTSLRLSPGSSEITRSSCSNDVASPAASIDSARRR